MRMDEQVELADAIAALRVQLSDALRAGRDEDVRFRLGPVELEFALTVRRDVHGEGGIKFWVISLGAGAGTSHDTVHRVKLTLQPLDVTGEDLKVRSEQAARPR
jgi:Trypsin-co-occurring domain 2